MTLTKKLEENKLTIIGTAALLLTLWAGYQSGIFSSQESMEQFLRKTGALTPLFFLFLQTVQVVIPVVPGGVCDQFSSGKALWPGLFIKICISGILSKIHFLDRKRQEV